MKKIVMLLAVVLVAACGSDDGGSTPPVQKDFKVTNGDGEEITEGKVFTFSELGASANIHIQIKNLSGQDLYFKLKAESGENTSGVPVNFCFGEVCLFSFNPGVYVPPTIYDNVMIAPGETNDVNDKFFITEEASISAPVMFNFGLYQYDEIDQDQTTGTKVLSFSYKYVPN